MSPLEAMTCAHWDYGACRIGNTLLWMHLDDEQRQYLKEQMRAALTALRDCGVTEGMRNPARPAGCVPGEIVRPETLFRAMLDAALQEG